VCLRSGRYRLVGDPSGFDRFDGRRAVPDRFAPDSTGGKGFDVDDDGRVGSLGGRELSGLDASGHRDSNVRLREIVRRQRFVDALTEITGDSAGHPERFAGRFEPVEMSIPQKHLTTVRPTGLEGRVTVSEATVVDVNSRRCAIDQLAV